MTGNEIKLVVCDLDNTLYDWYGYFVPAFYSMVDVAVEALGCDRERLLDEFRKVHQYHHDSEHPFALLETESVKGLFSRMPAKDVIEKVDPALHAFNKIRKERLQLHPGVEVTLNAFREMGKVLVIHTESKLFAAVDRLVRFDIMQYFSRVYCRERPLSKHPDPVMAARWLERLPVDKFVELSRHQQKPDPGVLLEICEREGVTPASTCYVGDSIARDMLMAKRAGVLAVWAAYGAIDSDEVYQKLVRVSHWTKEDVKRERMLRDEARAIAPDFICQNGFEDLLSVCRGGGAGRLKSLV